ncbi:DUF4129 domain-containing protein [Halobacteriales archaeon SW_7_65_23]|nr:MAG: DUF4129 domain-containing protein [Halobacteriales archaeon SW_7_65_23]
MNGPRRLLLVAGCVVCLLVLSSALPAADPRLDAPQVGDSSASEGSTNGGWDDVIDDPGLEEGDTDDDADEEIDTGTESDSVTDIDPDSDIDLDINGDVVPGNELSLEVSNRFGPLGRERSVMVNGERAGTTDDGDLSVTVPYTEEMNVSIPSDSVSRTLDVATEASIEFEDGVAQKRNVTAAVQVGSTSVPGVPVSQDGETVGTTDENGEVTLTMPERVGTTDVRAERGAIAVQRSVELPAPEVSVTSPFVFPGLPAPVAVTANGEGVPNATIDVAGGGTVTTDDDGTARIQLPIDNEATLTATFAGEETTTTIGRLYLRLTVVVVLVPGVVGGFIWTYLKLAARREGSGADGVTGSGFGEGIGIVAFFLKLADALAALIDSLRMPSLSEWSFRLPRPSFGLSSLAGLTSVSMPSISLPRPSLGLGSLLQGQGSSERSGLTSSIRERLGFGTDDDEEAAEEPRPSLAEEPLGPPEPRTEVRAYWHAFLDRVGLGNRKTYTPGQAARRALSAGFPVQQVRRLLSVFREVEYGGREPSSERVAEARAAAADLLDHDPDEEGSE